jgi:hypothetical protein
MFASIPQAEKLPPGDTRVIMPTPPLTVSVPSKPLASENLLAAPSRLLPYRSLPAVAVAQSKPAEYPAPPLFMPKAEKLPPGETRVFPPASAEKPVAGSPYRTGVPAVTTSLQKKPAVGQTAPAVQTAPSEVSAPPAGERRWPAAFTGQGTPPQSESPTILRQPAPSVAALPVAAVKIPAAEPLTAAPRPAQGVDIPVAVPVKPDCGPVTSSVSGPCEPRRPLLKRWFGKKSCPEDPCAKDPCAKDPCAGVPSVAVKGTPMPSGTKKPVSQQKLAQPEPSKGFEQRRQGSHCRTRTERLPRVVGPDAAAQD